MSEVEELKERIAGIVTGGAVMPMKATADIMAIIAQREARAATAALNTVKQQFTDMRLWGDAVRVNIIDGLIADYAALNTKPVEQDNAS